MSGGEIIGGVGLTLFGVRHLRKGLDRLCGGQAGRWLARIGPRPLTAFTSGVGLGIIAPSSTGLSLTAVDLLGRGQVDLRRMFAVLLGAGVGLTVTVQLLAWNLQDYAGWLIAPGVAAFLFASREGWRGLGQCLLALGLLFLAMDLIGRGAQDLAHAPELGTVFHLLQGHAVLVFSAVMILTVLLQSSTASIALGLSLAKSGIVATDLLVWWVVATNLGLGLTTLAAGWAQLECRRLALGNLLIKAAVALPLLAIPGLARGWFESLPVSAAHQTAAFHTGFNLVSGLLALPVLGALERVTFFLVPTPLAVSLAGQESFLDPKFLDAPSLALTRATRETLRMADRVRLMLEHFWQALTSGNPELAQRIQREDDVLDRMNRELKNYLSRIADGKSPDETHWQFSLLAFSTELESSGDLIDKHLCDLVIKLRHEDVTLDALDQASLAEIYSGLLRRIELAVDLLTTRNPEAARRFLSGKEEFNLHCRRSQRDHYDRLRHPSPTALNASTYFVDFLDGLRRLNSHISAIGYAFLSPPARPVPAPASS